MRWSTLQRLRQQEWRTSNYVPQGQFYAWTCPTYVVWRRSRLQYLQRRVRQLSRRVHLELNGGSNRHREWATHRLLLCPKLRWWSTSTVCGEMVWLPILRSSQWSLTTKICWSSSKWQDPHNSTPTLAHRATQRTMSPHFSTYDWTDSFIQLSRLYVQSS